MTSSVIPQTTQNDVLFVRNTQAGPTVFTLDASRADGHVEWQGAGDVNGNDIQTVPSTILNNVQFQRSLRLGIFQLVDDPALTDQALDSQRQEWLADQARRSNAGTEVLEAAAENDLQIYTCLGPNCATDVPQSLKEHTAKPPLCNGHRWMAAQFTAQEDFNARLVNGKAPILWVKTTIER